MRAMRLFRRREPARPVERAATVRSAAPAGSATPVEMTGTTTHGAGNLARLFAAHEQADGGLLEMLGQLVPEPDNPAARVATTPRLVTARTQDEVCREPAARRLLGALARR